MNVNDLIASRRKQLNLTLDDIAKYVGVSRSTVQKWESGFIKNMRRDKMALLADILQIPPTMLLKDEIHPREVKPKPKIDLRLALENTEIMFDGKEHKLTEEQRKLLVNIVKTMVESEEQ